MDPPGSSVHGNLQQEYSSGLPFPPPGDLPHPGMKPTSLMPSALAGGSFTTSTTWELQDEVKWSESRSVLSDSLWPHGLHRPRNSPGQNTRKGSLSLLQGIFSIQESNPGLPHCRWILNQLSHKGSPSILEWVVYPFSRGSSWPRNWTQVSCIAGRFFTNWAIREALHFHKGIVYFVKILQADVYYLLPSCV